MRKALTISLNPEDWQKVQALARSWGGSYSEVIRKLIQAGTSTAADQPRIEKYRALLKPHQEFLADRASAFAKARRAGRASS